MLSIPESVAGLTAELHHFIVENIRTTRRFLKKLDKNSDIDQLVFYEIDKHKNTDPTYLLSPLKEGHPMGLISEAGLPCIADPGADIVRKAHEMGFPVIPLVGPSSVFLALMASGFNGQSFCFHGYLPIKKDTLHTKLKAISADVKKNDQTQIFIEAPYRNMKLLESILSSCPKNMNLCIASNLLQNDQLIISQPISAWEETSVNLHKKPTVFLLYK